MRQLCGRAHHIWDACSCANPEDDGEAFVARYRNSSVYHGECEAKELDETEGRPLQQALAYFRKQKEMLKTDDERVIETESRFKVSVDHDELWMLLQEEAEQSAMEGWVKFDMFFGVLVVLNGLMLGLSTSGFIDEDTMTARVIEAIFFAFFTFEWVFRWYHCRKGLCGMIRNIWTRFDLFTILVSMLDLILTSLQTNFGGANMVSVMRIIRLLRLVRLVRLVKLLQELYMLLTCLANSGRILAWTLLMHAMVCYIFGLFMFEVMKASNSPRIQDEHGRRHWGSVPLAMLSMAQVASFSDAHVELTEVDDAMGPWLLAVVLAFVFADALGILNLVVGVLLTTTLHLADRNERFKATTERILQHKALRVLRDALKSRCERKLGQMPDSASVTKDLLCEWLEDEDTREEEAEARTGSRTSVYDTAAGLSEMPASERGQQMSKTKSLTSLKKSGTLETIENMKDIVLNGQPTKAGMAQLFQKAKITELEIQAVFNESTSVHGHEESAISVDDFVQGLIWVTGQVHPLEVMSLLAGLRSAHDRMLKVQSIVSSASQTLQDTSDRVRGMLERYHTESGPAPLDDSHLLQGPDEHESTRLEALANAQKKLMMLSSREAVLAKLTTDATLEAEKWAAFDVVFANIILVNAFMIGAEVVFGHDVARDFNRPDWDGWSMFWFACDQLFLAIYCVEFVLRGVFYHQMRVLADYRTFIGFLPYILTHMIWPMQLEIVCYFPRWMKDTNTLLWLDFSVIIVAMVDNFVLRSLDVENWGKSLRVMGLLRLMRLARLLHLIKPLNVIAKGFVSNFKLIFWSMVVLIAIGYAGSITVVMLIGRQLESTDEDIRLHWSHIPQAMLTLGEMATWDDWSHRVQEVGDHAYWMYGFSVVFLCVAALGILNLITGAMVQAAFQIVAEQQDTGMGSQLNMTKMLIQDAITSVYQTIDEHAEIERRRVKGHITEMRDMVREYKLRLRAEEAEALKQVSPRMGSSPRKSDSGYSYHDTLDEESTVDVHEYVTTDSGIKCVYDDTNYCYITHVTWCTSSDVAVGVDGVSDGQEGPMHDAMLSLLVWDGIKASPVIFLPDQNLTGRHAVCQEDSESESDDGEKRAMHMESLFATMNSESRRRNTTNTSRGDLLFRDVPSNTRLRFRFGGNYSTVPVFAECPSTLKEESEMDVSEAISVDPDRVSVREMLHLLQDGKLIHTLAKVNLTPAQALIVFQTLNVMLLGSIKLTDYIDALLRMRRPTLGFDTAGAKSFMRRLVMQQDYLARDAEHCSMCFSHVVSTLRQVNIVENDVADADVADGSTGYNSGDEQADEEGDFINQTELTLVADAERIKMKNCRLQHLIRQRKLLTLVASPRIFGAYEDECEEFDNQSISSGRSGWD